MVAGYFTTDGGTEEEEISVNHLQLAKGDGGGVSNPPLTAALPSSPLPSPSRPRSIPSRPLPPPRNAPPKVDLLSAAATTAN